MSKGMTASGRVLAAWGQNAPDWVKALAEACDAASLRKVAERLSVSPAIISLAIGRKREKLDFIRDRVERILMVRTVNCPILGELEAAACAREQSRPFSTANPLRVNLYRTCHGGCPHYQNKEKKS